jgi:hypothetical protein
VSRRKKKKGERYIDRWLKEHPRISLYLNKEEYTRLMKVADSKNMSIKEFILSLIGGYSKYYEAIHLISYEEGYNTVLEKFKNNPRALYVEIKKKYNIEPALFSVPCSICNKSLLCSHADSNWNKKKESLYEGFKDWYHTCCNEVKEGKRESCEHMKRPGQ